MDEFLKNVEGATYTDKMKNFSIDFIHKHSLDEEVWVNADAASVLAIAGYLNMSGLESEPKESTLCGRTCYGTKVYIVVTT